MWRLESLTHILTSFWNVFILFFPLSLRQTTFPLIVRVFFFFFLPDTCKHWIFFFIFTSVWWYLIVTFVCDNEDIHMSTYCSYVFSGKILDFVKFCDYFVYILKISPLSDIWCANIFSLLLQNNFNLTWNVFITWYFCLI